MSNSPISNKSSSKPTYASVLGISPKELALGGNVLSLPQPYPKPNRFDGGNPNYRRTFKRKRSLPPLPLDVPNYLVDSRTPYATKLNKLIHVCRDLDSPYASTIVSFNKTHGSALVTCSIDNVDGHERLRPHPSGAVKVPLFLITWYLRPHAHWCVKYLRRLRTKTWYSKLIASPCPATFLYKQAGYTSLHLDSVSLLWVETVTSWNEAPDVRPFFPTSRYAALSLNRNLCSVRLRLVAEEFHLPRAHLLYPFPDYSKRVRVIKRLLNKHVITMSEQGLFDDFATNSLTSILGAIGTTVKGGIERVLKKDLAIVAEQVARATLVAEGCTTVTGLIAASALCVASLRHFLKSEDGYHMYNFSMHASAVVISIIKRIILHVYPAWSSSFKNEKEAKDLAEDPLVKTPVPEGMEEQGPEDSSKPSKEGDEEMDRGFFASIASSFGSLMGGIKEMRVISVFYRAVTDASNMTEAIAHCLRYFYEWLSYFFTGVESAFVVVSRRLDTFIDAVEALSLSDEKSLIWAYQVSYFKHVRDALGPHVGKVPGLIRKKRIPFTACSKYVTDKYPTALTILGKQLNTVPPVGIGLCGRTAGIGKSVFMKEIIRHALSTLKSRRLTDSETASLTWPYARDGRFHNGVAGHEEAIYLDDVLRGATNGCVENVAEWNDLHNAGSGQPFVIISPDLESKGTKSLDLGVVGFCSNAEHKQMRELAGALVDTIARRYPLKFQMDFTGTEAQRLHLLSLKGDEYVNYQKQWVKITMLNLKSEPIRTVTKDEVLALVATACHERLLDSIRVREASTCTKCTDDELDMMSKYDSLFAPLLTERAIDELDIPRCNLGLLPIYATDEALFSDIVNGVQDTFAAASDEVAKAAMFIPNHIKRWYKEIFDNEEEPARVWIAAHPFAGKSSYARAASTVLDADACLAGHDDALISNLKNLEAAEAYDELDRVRDPFIKAAVSDFTGAVLTSRATDGKRIEGARISPVAVVLGDPEFERRLEGHPDRVVSKARADRASLISDCEKYSIPVFMTVTAAVQYLDDRDMIPVPTVEEEPSMEEHGQANSGEKPPKSDGPVKVDDEVYLDDRAYFEAMKDFSDVAIFIAEACVISLAVFCMKIGAAWLLKTPKELREQSLSSKKKAKPLNSTTQSDGAFVMGQHGAHLFPNVRKHSITVESLTGNPSAPCFVLGTCVVAMTAHDHERMKSDKVKIVYNMTLEVRLGDLEYAQYRSNGKLQDLVLVYIPNLVAKDMVPRLPTEDHWKHGYPQGVLVASATTPDGVFSNLTRTTKILHVNTTKITKQWEGAGMFMPTPASVQGDCGRVLVSTSTNCAGVPVGMLIAGNGTESACVPFVRSDIEKGVRLLVASVRDRGKPFFDRESLESRVKNMVQLGPSPPSPIGGPFESIGKISVEYRPHSGAETKLRRSHLDIGEPISGPPVLSSKDGSHIDYVRKKWETHRTYRPDKPSLDAVVNLRSTALPKKSPVLPEVLSMKQVVTGVEGTAFVGLDLSTSPGYLMSMVKRTRNSALKGKHEFIKVEDDKVFIDKVLVQDVKVLEDMADRGRGVPNIYMAKEKDERLLHADLEKGKVRLIMAGGLSYLILFRMYFGAFCEAASRSHSYEEFASTIGISPLRHGGFEHLYNSLRKFGPNIVEVDFSGWDKGHPYEMSESDIRTINLWYAHEYGYNAKLERKRVCIFAGVVYGIVVIEGFFLIMGVGVFSGNPATGIINCISHDTGAFMVFDDYVRSKYGTLPTKEYPNAMRTKVFGDDGLYSVRVEGFDQPTFARLFHHRFGMDATPAGDKHAKFLEYQNMDDASFLKRKFVTVDNEMRGCLDKSVIYEMARWYRTTASPIEGTAILQNVEAALREAFLWGRDYFDKVNRDMSRAMVKRGFSPPCLSYDKLFIAYHSDDGLGTPFY